jgi:hypothetical protein
MPQMCEVASVVSAIPFHGALRIPVMDAPTKAFLVEGFWLLFVGVRNFLNLFLSDERDLTYFAAEVPMYV